MLLISNSKITRTYITTISYLVLTTIARAEKALYQAKELGRNQVVLNTFE